MKNGLRGDRDKSISRGDHFSVLLGKWTTKYCAKLRLSLVYLLHVKGMNIKLSKELKKIMI